MIANYHTHTWRCGHAEGTERDYAQQAEKAGIRILGFSDHTPYDFFDSEPRNRPMRVNNPARFKESDEACPVG